MDKNRHPTTLAEIKLLDKEMLMPQDVSGYLRCNHHSINIQAQKDKEKLGFPVCVMNSRVYIPKAGFIEWAEGKKIDAIIEAVEKRLAVLYGERETA